MKWNFKVSIEQKHEPLVMGSNIIQKRSLLKLILKRNPEKLVLATVKGAIIACLKNQLTEMMGALLNYIWHVWERVHAIHGQA